MAASIASAAALKNEDVIKMAQAKVDASIIIASIENSEAAFDVSPQGLIGLSAAQVPQPVIASVIKRASAAPHSAAPAVAASVPEASSAAPAASSGAVAAAPASDLMSPSEVLFADGDKVTPMRYLSPQTRTAARALGLGGVATYAVLRSSSAAFRIHNQQPSFLVLVPDQAQPESYITLASFAVRPNGSREVLIGGGYMSYSTGVHPDRVIAVDSEKAADQAKAPKGFTIYRITPKHRLAIGQYAMILYTGEMHSLVASWFSGTGNSYFDFAVE